MRLREGLIVRRHEYDYCQSCPPAGEQLKQITRDTLKKMIDEDVDFILLDSRAHESYDKEHLPGAISIPSDHLAAHILKDIKKTRTIVTYCSSFTCEASTVAAKKLERFGFAKVLEFKGGLEDWKKAGYPTER